MILYEVASHCKHFLSVAVTLTTVHYKAFLSQCPRKNLVVCIGESNALTVGQD